MWYRFLNVCDYVRVGRNDFEGVMKFVSILNIRLISFWA